MITVTFPKLGPEERALCYSFFRSITSGIGPTKAKYASDELYALNTLYAPKNLDRLVTSISEAETGPSENLVPLEVWNGPKNVWTK
jgi:hypothetical protein